ncbi:MAG: 2-C-methyl-D-erythritol 4-phosphate cytidylyltransferase [Spirochaetales bacterium]|nr:2-C-methyl-D-erythritol 4-phosphate cytidylyltransferase [Spirochaetales bacterium]
MGKETPKAAVIITAAGSSQRMGHGSKKEFLALNKQPVLLRSILPFVDTGLFSNFVIVLPESEISRGRELLSSLEGKVNFTLTSGGSTRQDSVFNGLKTLEDTNPDIVLIHDGARPWITKPVIESVLNKTVETGASVPIVPSVNAMKTIDPGGIILSNLKREFTVAAQTPQGFKFKRILESHRMASSDGDIYIDDAEIFSKYGGSVSTVPGDLANRKITYISDLQEE